jgi:hypothetical protein
MNIGDGGGMYPATNGAEVSNTQDIWQVVEEYEKRALTRCRAYASRSRHTTT